MKQVWTYCLFDVLTGYKFEFALGSLEASCWFCLFGGFDAGYKDGSKTGYAEGYGEGKEIGEETGFNDGYDIGYSNGLSEGIEDSKIYEEYNNRMR